MNHRDAGAERDPEDGFTLIEMLAVVGILGMVLAMVMGMMITIVKIVGNDTARVDESQQSKVALESMTKSLRTAVMPKLFCSTCDVTAFINGNVRSVSFYANINSDEVNPATMNNNGPSKVSYTVKSNGELVETIRRPNLHAKDDSNFQYTCTAGTSGCVVQTRTIARGVSTTQGLFTYYDRNGTKLGTPLAGDDLTSVYSVDITLSVQTGPGTPTVNTVTRVSLPNAGVVVPTPSASS